jgi:hypothetical protein
MSDMLFSDKSKLTAKPDQNQQGPEAAPSISPMRIQRLGAMDLQRLVGNQATQRLLRQTDSSSPAVVQTKMTVGAADDAYEQEADAVAAQVVSDTPAPVQRESEGGEQEDEQIGMKRIQREAEEDEMQPMRIQREAEEDEMQPMRLQREAEEDEMQPMRLQREAEEDEMQPMRLQREEVDMMGSFDAGEEVESGIASTRGSGQALPDETRGMMESKMGHDFSGVSVHTDAQSDSLNRSVGAKAFTTGSDVYFSEGAFNPGSKDGQQLLAHELTHVVQQGGAAPKVQTEREDK